MWIGYWLLILKLRLIVLFSFFSLCDLMFDFAFVFGWVDLLLIALLFRLSCILLLRVGLIVYCRAGTLLWVGCFSLVCYLLLGVVALAAVCCCCGLGG